MNQLPSPSRNQNDMLLLDYMSIKDEIEINKKLIVQSDYDRRFIKVQINKK